MEKVTGGCHCKAVRYEAELDLSKAVIECNCSYCQMNGLLLTAVPDTKLTITGEDALSAYHFNTEKITHSFCKKCGAHPFGSADWNGVPTHMINVRTVDDVDLASLERMPFDGRSA